MKCPSIYSSADLFLSCGVYHIAMISADPALNSIKQAFVNVQNNLKEKNAKWKEAEDNTLIALAKRNRCDIELDRELGKFELELQKFVDRNKKSTEYQRFFPETLSTYIRQPLVQEIESVKDIEEKIDSASLPEELKKFKNTLKEKREMLTSSIEEYKNSYRKEGQALTELNLAKQDWIRQYRINYGEIIKIYPSSKAMLESYFKSLTKNKSSDNDENNTESEENINNKIESNHIA